VKDLEELESSELFELAVSERNYIIVDEK